MRIAFAVQGEGRGHMTQAIALHEALVASGHEVVGVTVGMNKAREIPPFFKDTFSCPMVPMESPNFVFKNNRSISMTATAATFVKKFGNYRASVKELKAKMKEWKPDILINFYEPVAGLYKLTNPGGVPTLAVGHQYMLEHPDYTKTDEFVTQLMGMKIWNALVSANSHRAALSFYQGDDLPSKRLTVVPPLLREQLFALEDVKKTGFILVYMLNHGYAEDLIKWHKEHPDQAIHCFYDKPDAPEEETINGNLTFHRLHGQKFLEMMGQCDAVVCTAGFESVCEAAYLDKPILMVPVENHAEQDMNAIDAEKVNFGIKSKKFDLTKLREFKKKGPNDTFRNWVDQAIPRFLRVIEQVADKPSAATSAKPAEATS